MAFDRDDERRSNERAHDDFDRAELRRRFEPVELLPAIAVPEIPEPDFESYDSFIEWVREMRLQRYEL